MYKIEGAFVLNHRDDITPTTRRLLTGAEAQKAAAAKARAAAEAKARKEAEAVARRVEIKLHAAHAIEAALSP